MSPKNTLNIKKKITFYVYSLKRTTNIGLNTTTNTRYVLLGGVRGTTECPKFFEFEVATCRQVG